MVCSRKCTFLPTSFFFCHPNKGNYLNFAEWFFPTFWGKSHPAFYFDSDVTIMWNLKWNFCGTKFHFWNIWPIILNINPWTKRTAWKIPNYCFDVLQFHSVFSKILIKEITFLKTRGCLPAMCLSYFFFFSAWLFFHVSHAECEDAM